VYIYALLYTATLWGDTVADVRRDGHEPTMGTALDHEFYPSFLYTSECSILGERLPTRVNTYPFAVRAGERARGIGIDGTTKRINPADLPG